ncbi:glycerate kinase [Mycolicibacterium cosmeticum]|uniref:glycerate kinase n=1 Tax=Mycolicibacterium cosmeticum TaxID=258533 RepID=UPI003204C6A3
MKVLEDNVSGGHVVVAPDKFKGSASATTVAAALSGGLRAVTSRRVVAFPIADGGEGTVDMMVNTGFEPVTCTVPGPLQRPVTATYALRGRTAVIEAASAAGLGLLEQSGPTPTTARTTTTVGVGALLCDALGHGVDRVVIGVGGSATTDGGAGLLVGLGARLLDEHGDQLYPCGADLQHVREVDLDAIDHRLRGVDLVVACDVDNPLTGPHGAAVVYGPQKGADPDTVRMLEHALTHWADAVAGRCGRDVRHDPGMGAAGGMAFAMAAALGARLTPGIDLLLELGGFPAVIDGAALVVVGEGSLDTQSLHGKGPIGVARNARAHGVPVVAVAGRSSVGAADLRTAGIDAVYTLAALESDELSSMLNAVPLLRRIGSDIAHDRLEVAAPRHT